MLVREIDDDAAAGRELALGPDCAAVQFNNRPGDGQAEPGAPGARTAGVVDAVEPVEDPLGLARWYAGALIADLEPDAAVGPSAGYGHRSARRTMPDRVGQQIGQQFVHACRITGSGESGLDICGNAYLVTNGTDLGDGVSDSLADAERLPVNLDRARLELGQLE